MQDDEGPGVGRRALIGGVAAASIGVRATHGQNTSSTVQSAAHFLLNPGLSIDSFGARPDASGEANWTAFLRCLMQCRQDGKPLLIPADHFEIQPPASAIDPTRLSRNARRSIPIVGIGGPGSSVLSLKTRGLHFASSTDWFDPTFEGFSIVGKSEGALLEIGNPNFSDPVNMMRIRDVYVENSSAQDTAVGVVLNYVAPGSYAIGLKSNVYSDGKASFSGTALRCRQVEAMSFIGGAAGNAAVGLQIIDGFNFGLSFSGVTFENSAVAVQHVSSKSGAHIFQACQFSNIADWSIESFAANTSEWIEFVSCNFAVAGPLVSTDHYQGVRIIDRRDVETPAVPKSGESLVNTTGRDLDIYIWGGEVSQIQLDSLCLPFTGSGIQLVRLKAGRKFAMRWKTMPTWIWQNGG